MVGMGGGKKEGGRFDGQVYFFFPSPEIKEKEGKSHEPVVSSIARHCQSLNPVVKVCPWGKSTSKLKIAWIKSCRFRV